jgi:lipoprotein-anchoring transpeptidase ErfK/SrfK
LKRFGLVCLGLGLAMCIWLGSQIFGAATAAIPPGHRVAPGAAATTAGAAAPATDTGDRIFYPRGQYPILRLPNGETHEIHSVLNVTKALSFGDYVWDAAGIAPGRVWVRIDLSRQLLSVFRGGDEIGTAVIIYGANDHPTPVGLFQILQKSQYYYSKAYDAPMPYSLRLTDDGVAMHASSVRERKATHGCIGLPLDFARLLYAATSRGDRVQILPENPGT